MSSTNDAILAKTGGPTINDGLASYYSKTAGETLQDAESRWLSAHVGVTAKSIPDKWYQYLRGLGYTGTLGDMKNKFWNA